MDTPTWDSTVPLDNAADSVLPEGLLPKDQQPQHQMQAQQVQPEGEPTWDSTEDISQYETPGQLLKTGLEGVARGIAGPLAPMAEKALGVDPKDILARKEINPWTHGIGEAVGLLGGAITGTGQAAVMSKAGKIAAEAVGLADVAKAAPALHKIGSEAVKQAAEMAIYQSGDEISKHILQDPHASTESAIANIGLAAALGGVGGAAIGSISPLWSATAGPKVTQMLDAVKGHLEGGKAILPEELAIAKQTLGVEVAPEIEAALSGNKTAASHFNILKEGQNEKILEGVHKLHNDISESVAQKLNILPEEVANYSENEAGHNLLESFNKEYGKKYGPIAEAFEKRNAEAAHIIVPDEARLDLYGKLLENGMTKVGTDSPAYKLYNEYGNRILAKDTVGGMDMLRTEIGGDIEKAIRAADYNTANALKDIRSTLGDFQEQQILSQSKTVAKEGFEHADALGRDLIKERNAVNQSYKEFAQMSSELSDHLGTGRFTGAGGLSSKLENKVSAEQLLNKFSFKGNADFIPFLQKNFPEVYEQVRLNELKRMIKPAILQAKGEMPINIKKLNDIIEKGMAGQKEYVQSVIPQQAIDAVSAATKLTDAIPSPKSSGTAGWMTKMFKDVPRSAMAAVAMLSGHNPLIGGLLGEAAQRLGRDVPDAIRLAHLKFLASDSPIKSEGFKAMVDYMEQAAKGAKFISNATGNVFKSGAQVLTSSQMPNEAERTALDKKVTKMSKSPEEFMKSQEGHLGHYLPDQQQIASQTTTNALQYLNTLKPQPHRLGPLDKEVPPQPAEIARYNRALDIAQQPAVILDHVKNGTLQRSDIEDIHNMYPSLYKDMVQKITNEMASMHSDDEVIPYKTRMGISLFMGTPVDNTMLPSSIQAAQPKPQMAPQQQGQRPKGGGHSMKSLGKSNNSYQTPLQAAQQDRSSREK